MAEWPWAPARGPNDRIGNCKSNTLASRVVLSDSVIRPSWGSPRPFGHSASHFRKAAPITNPAQPFPLPREGPP